eukprot:CAMPEP_0115579788 /NCGR_PEP_ID=MMETSP0272-20121206/4284_1 /TAXON_ID=71861 /ORGANISM="Scrippsiella trochoidea, Strain CCMP3099" /LENGTH=80 /DNA_ID=CAMNT_0003014673 /DNA_START=463 /DNA_END=700 /DNA_ORIENTATION=+
MSLLEDDLVHDGLHGWSVGEGLQPPGSLQQLAGPHASSPMEHDHELLIVLRLPREVHIPAEDHLVNNGLRLRGVVEVTPA